MCNLTFTFLLHLIKLCVILLSSITSECYSTEEINELRQNAKERQKKIKEKRRDFERIKKQLETLEELEVLENEHYKQRGNDDFFVGGAEDGSFQIFADKQNLDILKKCKTACIDGTFKTVPQTGGKMYYQMLVIFAVAESEDPKQTASAIAVGFILLKAKNGPLYEAALKFMMEKDLIDPKTFPKKIMCDFEIPLRNALRAVFTDSELAGCFYHFCACLYRNVAKHGLSEEYKTNTGLMSYFRQFMLLALGPFEKVKDYMDAELLDETKLEEKFAEWKLDEIQQGKVKDWIEYFKTTWYDKKYKMRDWILSDVVIRTNDMAESQNAMMKRFLGVHTPLWEFIERLQELSATSRMRWEMFSNSGTTNRRNDHEVQKNEHLKKARKQMEEGTMDWSDFLETCSKALKGKWESLQRMTDVSEDNDPSASGDDEDKAEDEEERKENDDNRDAMDVDDARNESLNASASKRRKLNPK